MRRYCFRLLREVIGKLGWSYRLWIPATVILSAVELLPPQFLQYFTEGTQNLDQLNGADFLTRLLIFGACIAAVQWLAILLGGILDEWLRLTISIRLKKDAVAGMGRTRIDALDTALRGDWMTRMSGDLGSTEDFLTQSLPDQVRSATMLVGSAALFFWFSGAIAFLPLVAAVFLAWFNIAVQRKVAPVLDEVREIEGGIFQAMIETFEGLRTIRSYGAASFTHGRIGSMLQNAYRAGMKVVKLMAGLMGLNEFVSQLIVTGLLALIAYRVRGDQLTANEALVYPFYINLFLGSAKGLVASAYDWNRFFIEGGRLASLLYDESKQEEDPAEIFGDFRERAEAVQRMEARGLTIAYGDDPPVIEGFDFSLARGELVALMGPSGCGKSTFAESFSGLRRVNGGRFAVELENGAEESFPQAPNFLSAFVEQQPYLFVGTIRDNITLGMERADDGEVRDALRETGLAEVVEERGGLDAFLGDRGRNMSVGQQYRLALCRALVSGRPFLFLDEPFAALDVESVNLVIEALHEERRNGTGIVLITHILPEGLNPDRVVEMTNDECPRTNE